MGSEKLIVRVETGDFGVFEEESAAHPYAVRVQELLDRGDVRLADQGALLEAAKKIRKIEMAGQAQLSLAQFSPDVEAAVAVVERKLSEALDEAMSAFEEKWNEVTKPVKNSVSEILGQLPPDRWEQRPGANVA